MFKKLIIALYLLIIITMATATFIGKCHGADYAYTAVYGSWWFTSLWALLAVTAVAYIVRRRVRRMSTLALHLALLLILAGALLTHMSAWRGMVHLRSGVAVDTYSVIDDNGNIKEEKLPFTMRLDTFYVSYHDGTQAEADYVSHFTVTDGGREMQAEVSMNNIYRHGSLRFYQSSYDRDGLGSVLAVNCDPWGIPVTYAGYALLFVSLVWMLCDPKGRFRQLLRSPLLKKGALIVLLIISFPQLSLSVPVLPENTASKFGRLFILYNNRVCPMQTFAVDFTKKLCGSSSYNGYTAEQVLTGFIFYGDEWCAEPVLKVKGSDLRDALQLPRHCSVNTFFNHVMGGYILGPYIREYYQGNHDAFHRQAADIDGKLRLVMELRRGLLLKVFPYTHGGHTTWYAPTDRIPDSIGRGRKLYMQNAFSLLYGEVLAGRTAMADSLIGKMAAYQRQQAGASLPTELQLWAERTYNAVPFVAVLSVAGLSLSMTSISRHLLRPSPEECTFAPSISSFYAIYADTRRHRLTDTPLAGV